jgi:hypothetical protein
VSQALQSVREIFVSTLSRKAAGATAFEMRQFIRSAARENDYDVTIVGDLDIYDIRFPTGETISFDGAELRLKAP